MLIPINTVSYGRSGSTLLMSILKSFSSVYVSGGSPYEQRELSYLYRLSAVPFSDKSYPGNIDWKAESLLHKSLNYVGSYPGSVGMIGGGHISQEEILMKLWEIFTEKVRGQLAGTRYYAEKGAHDVAVGVRKTLKGKSICLLRDPRDEYLSILNFNKKRGFDGFGVGQRDDLQFAQAHSKARKKFMSEFAELRDGDQAIGLTYESLIEDNKECIARLEAFLGEKFLESEWQKTAGDNFSGHSTSASLSTSVERWKREMSQSVREIFVKNIGPELEAVGYDLDV